MCKGPGPDDCVFETCAEMEEFYPELAGTTYYAVLYLGGRLYETYCYP